MQRRRRYLLQPHGAAMRRRDGRHDREAQAGAGPTGTAASSRVLNRSKTRSVSAAAIPGPSSATASSTMSSNCRTENAMVVAAYRAALVARFSTTRPRSVSRPATWPPETRDVSMRRLVVRSSCRACPSTSSSRSTNCMVGRRERRPWRARGDRRPGPAARRAARAPRDGSARPSRRRGLRLEQRAHARDRGAQLVTRVGDEGVLAVMAASTRARSSLRVPASSSSSSPVLGGPVDGADLVRRCGRPFTHPVDGSQRSADDEPDQPSQRDAAEDDQDREELDEGVADLSDIVGGPGQDEGQPIERCALAPAPGDPPAQGRGVSRSLVAAWRGRGQSGEPGGGGAGAHHPTVRGDELHVEVGRSLAHRQSASRSSSRVG